MSVGGRVNPEDEQRDAEVKRKAKWPTGGTVHRLVSSGETYKVICYAKEYEGEGNLAVLRNLQTYEIIVLPADDFIDGRFHPASDNAASNVVLDVSLFK